MSAALVDPDDLDGRPVLVDPVDTGRTIYATVTGWRTEERRPIVPAWLRNRQEAGEFGRFLVRHGAHSATFHLVRSPLYFVRLACYSPRGTWRTAAGAWDWVFDGEGRPLRNDAAGKKDVETYLKLDRVRSAKVRNRGLPVLAGVLGLAGAGIGFVLSFPTLVQLVVLAGAIAVLGKVGAPADRPLVASAVVGSGTAPVLKSELVIRALRNCGISAMNAKGADIVFVDPIARDGNGWKAVLDLPYGVTAADVLEKRDRLASGLRRPVGCVWPEPVHDVHSGRLVLWVGDQDLARTKQKPWPLLKSGGVDLFKGFPVGTDQRGRVISMCLMYANMIVGAIPRMGKTFYLRLLLLAAALDPTAEVQAYDLKGTGDLAPLEPVAHAYAAGDDDEDVGYGLDQMRRLQDELRRRTKVIRGLPRDLCPESKVTRELADRRQLRLHPIVVGVDECQRWFEHPEHGKEFERICDDLVRRGPATGIILILATQRVDAKSIPTSISGNAILRFCLKVMDHIANDMVLGTSAHKNGVRATLFTRSDRGIGWLSGEGDEPRITRAYYVDAPMAERVVDRAVKLREAAGTLSGYAAGERPDPGAVVDLLDDLRVMFVHCEVDRMWSERVCDELARYRPDVYGGWTPAALAAALRPHQLAPGQVWSDGANRNGYLLEAVDSAIARRQLERGDDE